MADDTTKKQPTEAEKKLGAEIAQAVANGATPEEIAAITAKYQQANADMGDTAFLVIDMLKAFAHPDFTDEMYSYNNEAIIPAIAAGLVHARKHKMKIVYVNDNHKDDDTEFAKMGWPKHAIEKTDGAKVVKQLKPEAGDKIINKSTYCGFHGTDLDDYLKAEKIKNLILVGCCTNICVMFTGSAAALRGYNVALLGGATASHINEAHNNALVQMESVLGIPQITFSEPDEEAKSSGNSFADLVDDDDAVSDSKLLCAITTGMKEVDKLWIGRFQYIKK